MAALCSVSNAHVRLLRIVWVPTPRPDDRESDKLLGDKPVEKRYIIIVVVVVVIFLSAYLAATLNNDHNTRERKTGRYCFRIITHYDVSLMHYRYNNGSYRAV